eukprot:Gregarina_sp_Poly_1__10300@NODE_726_length_6582_cov_72_170837_g544_i0_p5_GENE_NODE_726_length_6582_cov_72_170837_g544_i0NODE_726_length_6582_cov_72_170837_g544_i0_p5_ORF_typecomplete_len114_score8_77_NODE_726_length_6582_cov_72_170837_g544_i060236364
MRRNFLRSSRLRVNPMDEGLKLNATQLCATLKPWICCTWSRSRKTKWHHEFAKQPADRALGESASGNVSLAPGGVGYMKVTAGNSVYLSLDEHELANVAQKNILKQNFEENKC